MRINIQAYKKKLFDKSRISLSSEAGSNFLDVEGCQLVGPLALEMEIEFTGSSYLLSGTVEGTMRMQCSRCLADTEQPLQGEFFRTLVESEQVGAFGDQEDVLPVVNDEVDLSRAVYEALLMAIPVAAACSPDCKGLCPGCGQNLNSEECQCAKEDIDPRWEKLAQINTRRNTDGST